MLFVNTFTMLKIKFMPLVCIKASLIQVWSFLMWVLVLGMCLELSLTPREPGGSLTKGVRF